MTEADIVVLGLVFAALWVVMLVWPYLAARVYERVNAVDSTHDRSSVEPTGRAVWGTRVLGAGPLAFGWYVVGRGLGPGAERVSLVVGFVLLTATEVVVGADARVTGTGRTVGDAPGPDVDPTGTKLTVTRLVELVLGFLAVLLVANVVERVPVADSTRRV